MNAFRKRSRGGSFKEREIEKAVREIKKLKTADNVFLFFGDILNFDKGACGYLSNLSNMLDPDKLFLVSETNRIDHAVSETMMTLPTIVVPRIFIKNVLPKDIQRPRTEKIIEDSESRPYLKNAEDNLCAKFPEAKCDDVTALSLWAYIYFSKMLEILTPNKIILWNKYQPLHVIIDGIAKEKDIPVLYMEFGNIPGTFVLEYEGQMGESLCAKNSEEFKELYVSENELQQADVIAEFLRESKLNRNLQPESKIEELRKQICGDKPIILYCGQNDFESGMVPYTHDSKINHSPIFESSDSAAEFLSDIASKNDWNLLYKPHPLMTYLSKIPASATNVAGHDINDLIDMADVVVTMFSQSAYISLIRGKPTVMLGYNQLKGKDCTYEAFHEDEIEDTIKQALSDGRTESMRENFTKHVAQELKYYLFDDLTDRNIRYGQEIEKFRNMIYREQTTDHPDQEDQ